MEALGRGDIAARSAVDGAYHGHDGLRKFFADNDENFEVFEPRFREIRDLGHRIVLVGTIHIRARGSAGETDIPVAGIFTFKHGKLIRWEDFRERSIAREAVALAE